MNHIELFANFIIIRDSLNSIMNQINSKNTEIAIIDSEPKSYQFDNNTSGYNNDKQINNLSYKDKLLKELVSLDENFIRTKTTYDSLLSQIDALYNQIKDKRMTLIDNEIFILYKKNIERLNFTLSEIASVMNLDESYVRKINASLIKKIDNTIQKIQNRTRVLI